MTQDELLQLIDQAAAEGWTRLELSRQNLEILPPEISRLKNLCSLQLRLNNLSSLTNEIGKLSNLRSLDISGNQLKHLPEEVGKLTQLESLNISDNQISSLSKAVGKLSRLKFFNLSRNKLTELPEEIGQLIQLEELDLYSNNLTYLPKEIGNLRNLIYLYLRSNKLTEIGAFIGQINNLKRFDVYDNRLKSLPPELGILSALDFLSLGDNPDLQDPPPEIVARGTQSILSYLRQQLEQGRDYLYEAKFLILGEGGAGKTTLAKKIVDPSYALDNQEKSTEGIDVIRWNFILKDGTEFKANIWDFGGQEIYHSTHQFFLTKRSLYALVVDTRQDNTDLYYWLNVIELLSDSSPVFIIKNEKQNRQCEVDERQLRGEFKSLERVLATNLSDNRGLESTKTAIEQRISQLPHVGSILPRKWADVRRNLETNTKNYITLIEYEEICKDNGFINKSDQLQLSEYLHDLGVCLHFQEDPILKNTIILKPEWGTAAVYKVLDTQEICDNFGRFSRVQLNDVWNNDQHAMMRDELLQLMKRFKLCYPIPGSVSEYIAPQLLGVEKPNYKWVDGQNLLLRYFYDFMPKGIISRLIVEMYKFIEAQKLVWKSGVVLTNESARAEVIEYYHKGEIHVRVNGSRQKDLLTVITHEIDKINASYERIRVQKLIPCNCELCLTSNSPQFFSLDILNRFIDNFQAKIQCQNSFMMVDVRQLILGVSDPLYDSEVQKLDRRPSEVKTLPIHPERRMADWPVQILQESSIEMRMELFDALSRLPNPQFEKLIFMLVGLGLPRENLGGGAAAQGERVSKLLEWAESQLGCGLAQVEQVLNRVRESNPL